jgi:uncharacterized membrane protein SpoIIM required for sporulation
MRSLVARLTVSFVVMLSSAAVPVIILHTPAEPGTAPAATLRPRPMSMEDFQRILMRNQVVALATASGILTGGATTVTSLSTAAYVTAQTATDAQSRLRLSGRELAALLLPHGVIELTGLAVAGAAGLNGLPLLIALAEGRRSDAGAVAHESARLFVAAVALIAIAAFVEVTITPAIAAWAVLS